MANFPPVPKVVRVAHQRQIVRTIGLVVVQMIVGKRFTRLKTMKRMNEQVRNCTCDGVTKLGDRKREADSPGLAGVGFLFACCLLVLFVSGCREHQVDGLGAEGPGKAYRYPYFTDNDYAEKIADGIVLLDFDADWCGFCRKMDPHLAKLHDAMGDRITIAKIDYDTNPKAVNEFGVQGIPALFVFVDGKLVNRALGYQDEKQLFALVEGLTKDLTNESASKPDEDDKGVNTADSNLYPDTPDIPNQ